MKLFCPTENRLSLGFTLIEILLTLSLVSILAVLSLRLTKPASPTDVWGRRCVDFLEHLQASYRIHSARTGLLPYQDPDLCGPSSVSGPAPISNCRQTRTQYNGLRGLNAFLVGMDETAGLGTVTIGASAAPYLDYPMGVRLWLRPELVNTAFKTRLDQAPFASSVTTYNDYHEFMIIDFDKKTVPTSLSDTDIVPIWYIEETGDIQTWNAAWNANGTQGPIVPPSFYDSFRNQS